MQSVFLIILLAVVACQPVPIRIEAVAETSGTQVLLQAISIVDDQTIWISGHQATVCLTTDGGNTWQTFQYKAEDSLQFRDIHGFGTDRALVMSAGMGETSRILSFTPDSGFEARFIMPDSLGFLNSMAFWDDLNGIAYGDAIDAYPYILLTRDGGRTWIRSDSSRMPNAGPGEGGFAASGTCVVTGPEGRAWIATGGGGNARFLNTEDFGYSWTSVPSPLIKGESAGNISISMAADRGFVVGGDLERPDFTAKSVAFSEDSGRSWLLANPPGINGPFYGGAIKTVKDRTLAVAVGPAGISYTWDKGRSWELLDTLNYWAISLSPTVDFGYAAGTEGKILRLKILN